MRRARLIIGAAIWAFGIGCVLFAVFSGQSQRVSRAATLLGDYWWGPKHTLELTLPKETYLALGDPIFYIAPGDEHPRLAGEVRRLGPADAPLRASRGWVTHAGVLWYPSAPPLSEQAKIEFNYAPQSLAWVVQTLLPPERKQRVMDEISSAFEANRDDIIAALAPIVEDSLREGLSIVERDLPKAIDRHRDDLQVLGQRYQHEIVEAELLPMVKSEVLPIIRDEAEPVVREIGRELWDRVSIWRFSWRFLYDRSPLPERDLVEREWKRFVDREAMPVFEDRADQLANVARTIVQRTADNERVKTTLREQFGKVVDDPDFRVIMTEIAREVFVENEDLKEAMRRHWTSPRAMEALQFASDRLEPTVRRVADMMFGTREEGITPEFAQVLRSQILLKDRRWFLATDPAPHEAGNTPKTGPWLVEYNNGEVQNPFVERMRLSTDAD